ncbi:MAG TPA: hypothetical protein VED66_09510, partial [Candidatus Sulfotelmatobacter sp.]|nr:hypothetical protein [Candidatus Sulfotelmatobacter sp.]
MGTTMETGAGDVPHQTPVLGQKRGVEAERLFREVEGRVEARVEGDLVASDELVGFIGHADDGLKLLKHGGSHAFGEGGGSVGGDAVV